MLFVLSLVIISGVIGVQDPNKDELDDDDTPTTRAVVYGLLVGFVVYSFFSINAYFPKFSYIRRFTNNPRTSIVFKNV